MEFGYIELLPSFRCHIDGRQVRLPKSLQVLVVALALGGGASRQSLASRLWPDLEPPVSAKRLRQLLWRLRRESGEQLLVHDGDYLRLSPEVRTDLQEADRRIRILLDDRSGSRCRNEPMQRDAWSFLGMPLLCGWTVEGICEEQDRWDHLRSIALVALADNCLTVGDSLGIVHFASTALKVDKLNEAPYRLLALAYLQRGDKGRAVKIYQGYAALVRRQLGAVPTAEFAQIFPSGIRSNGSSGSSHVA